METQRLMDKEFRLASKKIADKLGLDLSIKQIGHFSPVDFNAECIDLVRRAAKRLDYSHQDIVSGAGHDAFWINKVAPTAMIMCPCVGGLSHNEAESISVDWANSGANVLLHAVVEMAEIESNI